MDWLQSLDLTLLNSMHQNLANPFFDAIMPNISALGNKGYVWIAAAFFLLLKQKYRLGGLMLSCALVLDLIACNLLLKPLVHRMRPFDLNTTIELLIARPSDFSFPSGHTAAAFAAATVIYQIDKKWGIAAFALAIMIAFSRLYLYVHFPSDVLAGVILGTASGICGIWLAKFIYKKKGLL